MKPCKKCGATDRTSSGHCRPCRKTYLREWHAANPEYNREWRATNPKYFRARRVANPEPQRAAGRKWRAANRDKMRELDRAWRGLPGETRPMPELCEMGCGRKAKCLDHCHKTNVFRGWLCGPCNSGLGMLGDTREALERAAAYLVAAQSEMWLAIPGHGLPRK